MFDLPSLDCIPSSCKKQCSRFLLQAVFLPLSPRSLVAEFTPSDSGGLDVTESGPATLTAFIRDTQFMLSHGLEPRSFAGIIRNGK